MHGVAEHLGCALREIAALVETLGVFLQYLKSIDFQLKFKKRQNMGIAELVPVENLTRHFKDHALDVGFDHVDHLAREAFVKFLFLRQSRCLHQLVGFKAIIGCTGRQGLVQCLKVCQLGDGFCLTLLAFQSLVVG